MANSLLGGIHHNVVNHDENDIGRWLSREEFNVKAYGATGTGASDDWDAIQNCITATQAVNGTLVFPPGTYKFSKTLNITGRLRMRGEGYIVRNTNNTIGTSAVILTYTGSGNAIHVYNDTDASILSGIVLENFELKPSISGAGTYGIYFDASDSAKVYYISSVAVRDVLVKNFGTDGIYCKGTIFDATFDRVDLVNNTRYGLYIDNTGAQAGDPSQITLIDPWITPSNNATSWGIKSTCNIFRVFGGTIYGTGVGNGAFVLNSGAFFGTSIEGASGASTVGVRYRGTTTFVLEGGFVGPNWAIGVQIGDPDNKAEQARGWVINEDISGNTVDLYVVDGGLRRPGVILNTGNASGATPALTVTDDRYTIDGGSNEWCYLGDDEGKVIRYTDGGTIQKNLLNTGFTINSRLTTTAAQVYVNGGGAATATFLIEDTASGTTPKKYLRVATGNLEVVNNAFDAVILTLSDAGLMTIPNGGYNGGHLILGTYHLWIGTGGVLYIKDGAPANATDGTVVGAQT